MIKNAKERKTKEEPKKLEPIEPITLLALNISTFDTIEYLNDCIRKKIEDIKEEFSEASLINACIPIKKFCDFIDIVIEDAIHFYGFEERINNGN